MGFSVLWRFQRSGFWHLTMRSLPLNSFLRVTCLAINSWFFGQALHEFFLDVLCPFCLYGYQLCYRCPVNFNICLLTTIFDLYLETVSFYLIDNKAIFFFCILTYRDISSRLLSAASQKSAEQLQFVSSRLWRWGLCPE